MKKLLTGLLEKYGKLPAKQQAKLDKIKGKQQPDKKAKTPDKAKEKEKENEGELTQKAKNEVDALSKKGQLGALTAEETLYPDTTAKDAGKAIIDVGASPIENVPVNTEPMHNWVTFPHRANPQPEPEKILDDDDPEPEF